MIKLLVLALWSMVSAAVLSGVSQAGTVLVDAEAAYPEGPLWRDGKLLYVEYAGPGIKIWDGKRARAYWSGEHCGASGLIGYRNHHLLVACYDANTIVELDEAGRLVRTIDKDSAGRPFIGPNDFTADGAGGIYVSASGVYDLKAPISGTVLYLSAAGTLVEVANLIHYSNGLTLSKDGKNLLVAEMLAGRILSFPVEKDGTLGARSVWARLQDLAPPTPHALCHQCELRRGWGGHGVHHRRFRSLEGAVPRRRVSVDKIKHPSRHVARGGHIKTCSRIGYRQSAAD